MSEYDSYRMHAPRGKVPAGDTRNSASSAVNPVVDAAAFLFDFRGTTDAAEYMKDVARLLVFFILIAVCATIWAFVGPMALLDDPPENAGVWFMALIIAAVVLAAFLALVPWALMVTLLVPLAALSVRFVRGQGGRPAVAGVTSLVVVAGSVVGAWLTVNGFADVTEAVENDSSGVAGLGYIGWYFVMVVCSLGIAGVGVAGLAVARLPKKPSPNLEGSHQVDVSAGRDLDVMEVHDPDPVSVDEGETSRSGEAELAGGQARRWRLLPRREKGEFDDFWKSH